MTVWESVKDGLFQSQAEPRASIFERTHGSRSPKHSGSGQETSSESYSSRRRTPTKHRSCSRQRSKTLPAPSDHASTSQSMSDHHSHSHPRSHDDHDGHDDQRDQSFEDPRERDHRQDSYVEVAPDIYQSQVDSTHLQDFAPHSESPHHYSGVQMSPATMDVGIRPEIYQPPEKRRR